MSSARIGTGILLNRGDGASPEVFTALAEIVSLTPPGLSRNEIEVSNHNAGIEEKLLGMLRYGQVKGKCNWLPTDPTQINTGTGIRSDILLNTRANWRVTFPPSGLPHWTFPARVQMFTPPDVTPDTALQMDFALTLDGTITEVNS
jgi:hypothetical protein